MLRGSSAAGTHGSFFGSRSDRNFTLALAGLTMVGLGCYGLNNVRSLSGTCRRATIKLSILSVFLGFAGCTVAIADQVSDNGVDKVAMGLSM